MNAGRCVKIERTLGRALSSGKVVERRQERRAGAE